MTEDSIQVTKRDGTREPLDIEKLHKVVAFACDGLYGVSESQIELRANLSFYDGIKTSDIQESLIRAASELIDEKNANYQHVAGRLVSYHIRKDAYGSFQPPTLKTHVENISKRGLYEPMLMGWYSEDEWNMLDAVVDHALDESMPFSSMEIFRSKYLVRDRTYEVPKILESPQMAMILIAATMMHAETKDRLQKAIALYKALSRHEISLPTPIMAGMRTSTRQYSSCTLIECGDSIEAIGNTTSAIIKYISKRAGIGLSISNIRAVGSQVGNGLTTHTGVIPFLRVFQSAVRSCNQGGVRVGAATVCYPIWHAEVETMLPLKDNRGTEDTRVRHVDYCVLLSKVFYQRLIDGGNISLFNPYDVPELAEAFYGDPEKFEAVYVQHERDGKASSTVPAIELFSTLMQQRKSTGRVYIMNIDHANEHGSFTENAPIRMTNLCVEISLPTKPLESSSAIDRDVGIEVVEMEDGAYEKWLNDPYRRKDQPLPLIWEIGNETP